MKLWLVGCLYQEEAYEGMDRREVGKWRLADSRVTGPFEKQEDAIKEATKRAANNPDNIYTIFESSKTVKLNPPVEIQDVA